jgi:hypothetical protein
MSRVAAEAVRHWLNTVEPRIQSLVTSCIIRGVQNDTNAGFHLRIRMFSVVVIIAPLSQCFKPGHVSAKSPTRQHILNPESLNQWFHICDRHYAGHRDKTFSQETLLEIFVCTCSTKTTVYEEIFHFYL